MTDSSANASAQETTGSTLPIRYANKVVAAVPKDQFDVIMNESALTKANYTRKKLKDIAELAADMEGGIWEKNLHICEGTVPGKNGGLYPQDSYCTGEGLDGKECVALNLGQDLCFEYTMNGNCHTCTTRHNKSQRGGNDIPDFCQKVHVIFDSDTLGKGKLSEDTEVLLVDPKIAHITPAVMGRAGVCKARYWQVIGARASNRNAEENVVIDEAHRAQEGISLKRKTAVNYSKASTDIIDKAADNAQNQLSKATTQTDYEDVLNEVLRGQRAVAANRANFSSDFTVSKAEYIKTEHLNHKAARVQWSRDKRSRTGVTNSSQPNPTTQDILPPVPPALQRTNDHAGIRNAGDSTAAIPAHNILVRHDGVGMTDRALTEVEQALHVLNPQQAAHSNPPPPPPRRNAPGNVATQTVIQTPDSRGSTADAPIDLVGEQQTPVQAQTPDQYLQSTPELRTLAGKLADATANNKTSWITYAMQEGEGVKGASAVNQFQATFPMEDLAPNQLPPYFALCAHLGTAN